MSNFLLINPVFNITGWSNKSVHITQVQLFFPCVPTIRLESIPISRKYLNFLFWPNGLTNIKYPFHWIVVFTLFDLFTLWEIWEIFIFAKRRNYYNISFTWLSFKISRMNFCNQQPESQSLTIFEFILFFIHNHKKLGHIYGPALNGLQFLEAKLEAI